MFVLIIFIIHLNLPDEIVRFFKLTVSDVESNPGPWVYNIKNVVETSHHQGLIRYVYSAGMQCISNVYLAVTFKIVIYR